MTKFTMKYQLLLLWILTAFVSCQDVKTNEIKVDETANGITLSCGDGDSVTKSEDPPNNDQTNYDVVYNDENTGEYRCKVADSRIFVKFRTCDNCVELDMASLAGIVVGDVVATVAVGVAVYLIASKSRTSTNTPTKKRSDRQPLVNDEPRNRATNDHYQPLRPRQVQGRDEYDVLKK